MGHTQANGRVRKQQIKTWPLSLPLSVCLARPFSLGDWLCLGRISRVGSQILFIMFLLCLFLFLIHADFFSPFTHCLLNGPSFLSLTQCLAPHRISLLYKVLAAFKFCFHRVQGCFSHIQCVEERPLKIRNNHKMVKSKHFMNPGQMED